VKKKKIIKIFRKNQWFRAGAGAIIVNSEGKVLACERRDTPGSWQFPQGGLDAEEEPIEAVFREVEEETGISRQYLDLITTESKLLAYELPVEFRSGKLGRGQIQYWYVLRFTGPDSVISLGDQDEFKSWKWADMEALVEEVVSFRREVYADLATFIKRILS
jgi:putative (di)nucleoside polyphosphate hydrolase